MDQAKSVKNEASPGLMIPYGRQSISKEDIEAVVNVLRSDFLTQGPIVQEFENSVSTYCGGKYSVAVNSATSALHLACRVLGVTAGDYVWTSPITFVASANCALYCGAGIDFVDIDPSTYNMSVDALADKLARAKQTGRLPKVVIPVHLCGQACDMEGIERLSQQYGFKVIEDASHALGGTYKGECIGNGRYSDITVFSFHPVKIVTTGEGGVAVTNNLELSRQMQLLRSHGITREPCEMTRESDGPWYYQQLSLGFNYRMTDIQAAMGISQMRRLDSFVARRHLLARRYNELLKDLPVLLPWQHPDVYSGFHLYVIRLQLKEISSNHRGVFETLRAAGIGVALHYIPVYLQPFYARLGFKEGYCPEAERYYAEAVTLPLFPDLTEEQQDRVVSELREVCR